MIRHFLSKQFLGFLAVGGAAAFLHWLTRIILSIWLSFSLAVVIAYAVGMAVAFLLNSFFVFPKSIKPRRIQARDFVLVNVSFFPFVWVVSVQVNNWLKAYGMMSHSEALAHAIAISLPMLATFIIYKLFTFGSSDNCVGKR